MPPTLALFLWLILLFCLLYFDPARDRTTSLLASGVPVTWMFFLGSRLPAQWLGLQSGFEANVYEEGNLLDASIFSILILLAMVMLTSRSFRWDSFFTRNTALMTFLFFTLASVVWSDFPFVALKRWFKELGDYLIALVVLSDPSPLEALRTVLRRLSYLLIPLSILLIKYYPEIGKDYSIWTGAAEYHGATTSKNMLGAVCLISGVFFFWDTVTRWSERRERRTKRIILVNAAFIMMTLWLLHVSDSETSLVCLVMGCLVITAAHTKFTERHPAFLKVMIPSSFLMYVILAFGLDINARLAPALNRDPNLTNRTEIWKFLLNMHTNPIVGTGFQSFWLGSRLQTVWNGFSHINEAHNGYLDIYLNLGLIGLFLFIAFLIASYRTICKRFGSFTSFASLSLSMWTILVFYNVSEAAFQVGLPWLTFLLVGITVSKHADEPTGWPVNLTGARTAERLPRLSIWKRGIGDAGIRVERKSGSDQTTGK